MIIRLCMYKYCMCIYIYIYTFFIIVCYMCIHGFVIAYIMQCFCYNVAMCLLCVLRYCCCMFAMSLSLYIYIYFVIFLICDFICIWGEGRSGEVGRQGLRRNTNGLPVASALPLPVISSIYPAKGPIDRAI